MLGTLLPAAVVGKDVVDNLGVVARGVGALDGIVPIGSPIDGTGTWGQVLTGAVVGPSLSICLWFSELHSSCDAFVAIVPLSGEG